MAGFQEPSSQPVAQAPTAYYYQPPPTYGGQPGSMAPVAQPPYVPPNQGAYFQPQYAPAVPVVPAYPYGGSNTRSFIKESNMGSVLSGCYTGQGLSKLCTWCCCLSFFPVALQPFFAVLLPVWGCAATWGGLAGCYAYCGIRNGVRAGSNVHKWLYFFAASVVVGMVCGVIDEIGMLVRSDPNTDEGTIAGEVLVGIATVVLLIGAVLYSIRTKRDVDKHLEAMSQPPVPVGTAIGLV